jgi:SAM-dependent methyltransferase
MPGIKANRDYWNAAYGWPRDGDEWSEGFGNTDALWRFVIYPRISEFLPARQILEIGPGHGRWTRYLRSLCESLVLIDISDKCIEACKKRFSGATNIRYYINDGQSLKGVADRSIDFVFSFDSLVHAEKDIIEAYVNELRNKLTADGVAFIHHSNIGHYTRALTLIDHLPSKWLNLKALGAHIGSINVSGWRAQSMTGEEFRRICNRAGVACISQELISWLFGKCLTDAFSVFAIAGSKWDGPVRVLHNPSFAAQARLIKSLAGLYTR